MLDPFEGFLVVVVVVIRALPVYGDEVLRHSKRCRII